MNDFGSDPWVLVWRGLDQPGMIETIFSLGNGRIGVRASLEQGGAGHQVGTLVNGYHETWPIRYPEAAFGYAIHGQTIVYVPDATELALVADGRIRDLRGAEVIRRLDLRKGILITEVTWPHVSLTWERLVSFDHPELLALRVKGGFTESRYRTGWTTPSSDHDPDSFDPRRAAALPGQALIGTAPVIDGSAAATIFTTRESQMDLALATDLKARTVEVIDATPEAISFEATGPTVEKRVAYLSGGSAEQASAALAAAPDFSGLAREQEKHLTEFWQGAEIKVGGEHRLQQALNWIIFQLHQASARIAETGIPAKGLSGSAYEGHYFWDTDVFVLPFLAHHTPEAAAELIAFRHSLLPKARERAATLSHKGALFPWRTISGEEASAYYEAGTAQVHINADVVYGIDTYWKATADDDVLLRYGIEIAVETARLWADLGHYRDGTFHFSMVTGPDEYSALVDDNAYTNYLARFNLERAVRWIDWADREHPSNSLRETLDLDEAEIDLWRKLIDDIYLPREGEITPQDRSFLERKPWDWNTPADQYPLLLHFHPLVIYRHQVLKQADVVMAMFLLPEEFSPELTRANFDFYDPLTTGDSSLSAPIQAGVAARLGLESEAIRYLHRAAFLDFDNLAGNTADGIHLATAGGTWQAMVSGFGGFTHTDAGPGFRPRLPRTWIEGLEFEVRINGSRVGVEISQEEISLKLVEGEEIEVDVEGAAVTIGRRKRSYPIGAQ